MSETEYLEYNLTNLLNNHPKLVYAGRCNEATDYDNSPPLYALAFDQDLYTFKINLQHEYINKHFYNQGKRYACDGLILDADYFVERGYVLPAWARLQKNEEIECLVKKIRGNDTLIQRAITL